MALDFYNLNDTNRKELLFQLDSNDFDLLKNILIIFKKKTGLNIDPYTDIRIYQDHVDLVIKLIKEEMNKSKSPDKVKLQTVLDCFKQANDGLLAIGD